MSSLVDTNVLPSLVPCIGTQEAARHAFHPGSVLCARSDGCLLADMSREARCEAAAEHASGVNLMDIDICSAGAAIHMVM